MFSDEPTKVQHVHDSPENAFKANVFYTALDTLLVQLMERCKAVNEVADLFEFIVNPPVCPSSEDIAKQARRLVNRSPNDVTQEDLQGFRHYANFFQDFAINKSKALALLTNIYEKTAENLYPQICICLCIFLSIPVSVVSGECSFSKLALIKYCRRSTITQQRLTDLMILSTEHKLARSIDFDDFAAEKARKKVSSKK